MAPRARWGLSRTAWALGFACALLSSSIAHAQTVRRAILVSHNDGGPDLARLRYAQRDVMKMRDVLVELGGFEAARVQTMFNPGSNDVIKEIRALESAIAKDKAAGKQALLLFYYSGHSKDGSLRLGKTKLSVGLLRSLLEDSRADVRVAVIDACGAGEITRTKGGRLGPPMLVSLDDNLSARGQVIIASSSETEASQESDDIQGSFFTHYWVSGLRGDGDGNSDGKVTLEEAYNYAYAKTVSATVHTRGGVQHPTYRFDLRGAGEVVMANLHATSSAVEFPSEMAGSFMVFDMERQLVVAEVDKAYGEPLRIAVKGGTYAIKQRERDHLLMQRMKVPHEAQAVVDPQRMERVDFDDDYSKGAVINVEPVGRQQGWSGFSLSGGMGGQAFLEMPLGVGAKLRPVCVSGPCASPTFPATTISTLQLRYHGLFNKHVLLGADVNFGTRRYELSLNAGSAGWLSYDAQFFMTELGTSVMWEQVLWRFRFAAGPRLSGVVLYRYIRDDVPIRHQLFMNLTPGVALYAGYDITRFLHLEVGMRANYLIYAVDGFRNLGYASMTLALHADL